VAQVTDFRGAWIPRDALERRAASPDDCPGQLLTETPGARHSGILGEVIHLAASSRHRCRWPWKFEVPVPWV
jgi:hypothetical protein